MASFSKIQYRRKEIIKKITIKEGVIIKRRDRKEKNGEIEIYIRVVAAGVIGCGNDSFLEHLGHSNVEKGEATATVKHIKFHQRLDQQKWNI